MKKTDAKLPVEQISDAGSDEKEIMDDAKSSKAEVPEPVEEEKPLYNPIKDLAKIILGSIHREDWKNFQEIQEQDIKLAVSDDDVRNGTDHLKFRVVFPLRYKPHIRRSNQYTRDANPIHSEEPDAVLMLLSLLSDGALARDGEEGKKIREKGFTKEQGYEQAKEEAESIVNKMGVIAPGMWLSSIVDRFFSYPESQFPDKKPEEGEPMLEPACWVTYAKSRYSFPLVRPKKGSEEVTLDFAVSRAKVDKKHEDAEMMEAKFTVKTADFEGKEREVQETTLHIFPRKTTPKEIMLCYGGKSPVKLKGKKPVYADSQTVSIDSVAYDAYGDSIGRRHLGDKAEYPSPLAIQAKMPEVLFLMVEKMLRDETYNNIANPRLEVPEKKQNETPKDTEKREEAEKRAKAYDDRKNQIRAYRKEAGVADKNLEDLMNMKKMVYMLQESFFYPAVKVPLGEDNCVFTTNLTRVKLAIHVLEITAKTPKTKIIKGGHKIMEAASKILVTDLLTEHLVEYLRDKGIDLNLEKYD